ncbi:MAG: hypothetical protein AB1478_12420 [Nitrospirota bacterium]
MAVEAGRISVPDLAYLAGLFDGEGIVYNGFLYPKPKKDFSCRQCYGWYITAVQAVNLLKAMLPYLRIKKSQAILTIQFQEILYKQQGRKRTDSDNQIRECYRVLISKLNQGTYEKSGEFGENLSEIIPSQAIRDIDSMEGVETTKMSSNNNSLHENPTRKGRYSPSLVVIQGSKG